MSERESVRTSQIILVAGHALNLLMGVAVTLVLVRRLTAEDFGLFIFASTALGLGYRVVDAGLESALIAALARDSAEGGRVFRRVLRLRALLAGLTALVLGAIFFQRGHYSPLVSSAIVVAIVCAPLRSCFAYPAAAGRFRIPAAVSFGAQLVTTGGVIVGALSGMSALLELTLLLVSLRYIGTALLALAYARKPTTLAIEASSDAPSSIDGALLPLSLAAVANALHLHGDVFLIEALRGPAEVGAYGYAIRLFFPLLAVIGLVCSPVVAYLARIAKESDTLPLRPLVAASAQALLMLLPLAGGFLFAEDFYGLVGRGDIGRGAPTAALLGLVALIVVLGSVASAALIALGALLDLVPHSDRGPRRRPRCQPHPHPALGSDGSGGGGAAQRRSRRGAGSARSSAPARPRRALGTEGASLRTGADRLASARPTLSGTGPGAAAPCPCSHRIADRIGSLHFRASRGQNPKRAR